MARGESLSQWLIRMMQRTRPVIASIRLEHLLPGSSSLVDSVVAPRKVDADYVEKLCEDFSEAATEKCDLLAGYQSFAIVLHDSAAREIGSKSWRIKGALDEGPGGSEPANQAGYNAMLQTQNRFLFEHSQKTMVLFTSAVTEENVRLRAVVAEYDQKKLDMWKAQQELEDRHHERELEILTMQERFAKQDKLYGLLISTFGPKIKEYVSAAGAKAPGKPATASGNERVEVDAEVVKESAAASPEAGKEEGLAEILQSLSDEQQVQLVGILTPEQLKKLENLR